MFDFRSRFRVLVFFLAVFTGCSWNHTPAPDAVPATTIFIARHAEKDPTPGVADPGLTEEGQRRANDLRDVLMKHHVSALFTTDTARTRATVAPLAARLKIEPQIYDPKQPAQLAQQLREQHRGETVLVVGHSNTVLPLIEALGAPRPVSELSDADYDYLFEVTLPQDGVVTATVSHYGKTGASTPPPPPTTPAQ